MAPGQPGRLDPRGFSDAAPGADPYAAGGAARAGLGGKSQKSAGGRIDSRAGMFYYYII